MIVQVIATLCESRTQNFLPRIEFVTLKRRGLTMFKRFSCSDQASGYVHRLSEQGMQAKSVFQPRTSIDQTPFLVVDIPEHASLLDLVAASDHNKSAPPAE